MFNDLKPYSDYTAANLPWIDRYPAHWTKQRFKSVLKPVDVRSTTGEEELLTVSSAHGVVPRASQSVTMFKAASYIGHKLAASGDLVVNSLWAWGRGLGVSRYAGIVSSAYGVYRSRCRGVIHPDFLHIYVRSEPYNWELHERSRGIWISRLQMTDERFLASPFIAPPYEEQEAIATYLAHAHQRINKAIKTKRRLISLWEEEKDTIVVASVSGGLRSDEYLTASIRGWRDYCPSGWEVVALRHRYVQELGKMLLTSRFTGEHAVPYLRNVDVRWGSVRADNLPLMDIAEEEYDRYTVRSGDVLVCEGGAGIGRAAVWEGEGTVGFQKALHRLRPIDPDRDDPRFLVYVFRACWAARVFTYNSVSTIPHLTGEQLRALRFPWPSAAEQRAIVTRISAESALIESKISGARREIDLLEEFKARLTADVVTGQVDVRAIAATLPPIDPAEAFDVGSVGVEDEVDVEEGEVEVSEELEVA